MNEKNIEKKEFLDNMREIGKKVSLILEELKKKIFPGISGIEIEKESLKLMKEKKIHSSSLGYRGFPSAICLSINNELTHGIPNNKIIKDNDLVSLDLACYQKDQKGNYYHADAATTFFIGKKKNKKKEHLINITNNVLHLAIKSIIPNITTTKELGKLIEESLEKDYFSIREYGGHGIGNKLHLEPFIPNYNISHSSIVIKEGTFICIEPLVQEKDREIKISSDNWTVISKNGYLNAHFEHTIYIGKKNIEIMTPCQNCYE